MHESFELQGTPGVLQHHLQHYAYRDVSDHVISIDHYTTLAAEQWMEEGRRTRFLELLVHPPAAFLRNYIVRRGFTDGAVGFLVSALNSYYVFMKLAKLWELQHRVTLRDHSPLARRRAKFARTPNALAFSRPAVARPPVAESPVPPQAPQEAPVREDRREERQHLDGREPARGGK